MLIRVEREWDEPKIRMAAVILNVNIAQKPIFPILLCTLTYETSIPKETKVDQVGAEDPKPVRPQADSSSPTPESIEVVADQRNLKSHHSTWISKMYLM